MFSIKREKGESGIPDPVDLVRKAIQADLDSAVFTERAVDVAANSIEFCTSHKFLGASDPLWPRQIQMLARFFEDVCYFCSDTDYVYNVPVDDSPHEVLDRFCLLEHGVCPRCRRNRLEILSEWQRDPKYARYHEWDESAVLRGSPPNEFIGIWGQRSGKSFAVATFFWPYILHRYLAIPNITSYFRLASNTVLEAAFVAPTKNQIDTYMWTPFKNVFDSSPWFREYVSYLKDEEKRLGIQMHHRQQTFMTFPTKRLAIFMKAANSGTLRGGTRFLSAVDELGWFNITEDGKKRTGVKDGVEVFTSLDRSLYTVRVAADNRRHKLGDYNAVDGYMFCISSPSSINDAIEQRAAAAPKYPRTMFTRFPTWQVNPVVTKEATQEMAGGDSVKFNRDYGAQPPRAASPFIEPSPFLYSLVDKEKTKRPLFLYEIKSAQDTGLGVKLLRPTITRKIADRVTPRVLTVDNGEKSNSFSICLASYYPEHEGVLYGEFAEVAPQKDCHVDLQWCYDEFILMLVKHFNIKQVVYDRWESSYAVRDLRTTYNIDALRYSLAWKDFKNFREDLLGSKIWFPVPEVKPDDLLSTNNLVERARYPRAHFQLQLTTVNQFGKKVTKPEHGNDDLFRTGVLAHWAIYNHLDLYRHGVTRGRRGQGGRRQAVFSTAGRYGRGAARRAPVQRRRPRRFR